MSGFDLDLATEWLSPCMLHHARPRAHKPSEGRRNPSHLRGFSRNVKGRRAHPPRKRACLQ
eukprot:15156056-Alexandrium_andersonii.AAC.1